MNVCVFVASERTSVGRGVMAHLKGGENTFDARLLLVSPKHQHPTPAHTDGNPRRGAFRRLGDGRRGGLCGRMGGFEGVFSSMAVCCRRLLLYWSNHVTISWNQRQIAVN